MEQGSTYIIPDDGKSITCLVCKRTSHHPEDVRNRYCGECHKFHKDMIDGPIDPLNIIRSEALEKLKPYLKRGYVPYVWDILGALVTKARGEYPGQVPVPPPGKKP